MSMGSSPERDDEDTFASTGAGLPVSSAPVTARCALFGVCGGCQLQHVPYDEQLAWKTSEVRRLLAEALPDDADLVQPCVGSPRAYGYRSKLTPHFPRPRAGGVPPIGFVTAGLPRRTVDVPSSPLPTHPLNPRLPHPPAHTPPNTP